jgi:hypothetical protein
LDPRRAHTHADLDHTRAQARIRALDDAVDRTLDFGPNHDFDPGRILAGEPQILLGHMISRILASTDQEIQLSRSKSSGSFIGTLAIRFSNNTISMDDYSVSPDLLEETVLPTIDEIVERLGNNDLLSTGWERRATNHFKALVEPVLARDQEATARTAPVMRILLLGLAAEAAALDCSSLRDNLRNIAVAITWLERRVNGNDRAVEAIVLARN